MAAVLSGCGSKDNSEFYGQINPETQELYYEITGVMDRHAATGSGPSENVSEQVCSFVSNAKLQDLLNEDFVDLDMTHGIARTANPIYEVGTHQWKFRRRLGWLEYEFLNVYLKEEIGFCLATIMLRSGL